MGLQPTVWLLLAAFLGQALLAEGKTCYNCGYMCHDIENGGCVPKPIGDNGQVNFCGDLATMSSMTKDCDGSDDCCGSLVEYSQVTNEATHVTTVDKIAFHGCEKDLASALSAKFGVICDGHTDSCYNITRDEINDEFMLRAEACFCEGDRCNNNTPDLPDTPPGPTKTCYNCGYKCNDLKDDSSCVPVPIDTHEGQIPFCGDRPSMSSQTKQCGGSDECCGAMREYFEFNYAGTTKVDMITFHGCEKDLAGALHSNLEVICDSHANSCYNISKENIQDDFLIEAAACFCDGDRCNNNLPGIDFPPAIGGASIASASILSLTMASIFLN